MAKIFQKGPAMKQAEQRKANFEVKNVVRLGTRKAPAHISVQTQEREQELAAVFEENGWTCVIEVDSEQDEDIRNLEVLQNKQVTITTVLCPVGCSNYLRTADYINWEVIIHCHMLKIVLPLNTDATYHHFYSMSPF